MKKIRKNIKDQKFNRLTVIEHVGKYKSGDAKWKCECECGAIVYSNVYRLSNDKIQACRKCSHECTDYTGQKIGQLFVERRTDDKIGNNGQKIIQWQCKCECGEEVIRIPYHLKRGNCCCKKCKANNDRTKFGYQEIRQHYWYSVCKNAYQRDINFNLTIEEAWGVYENQQGKCALSGMPIGFAKTKKGHATGETTASLDRINSNIGYEKDNIQWLHKWVNCMKFDYSQKEFIELCRAIVKYQDDKNQSF